MRADAIPPYKMKALPFRSIYAKMPLYVQMHKKEYPMKRLIFIALTAALLLSLTACSTKAERTKYEDAVELFEQGMYASALKLFEESGDYKDTANYIKECRYYAAMQTLSPDSSLEDGYSGNVTDCTADNASAYAQAVTTLEELDGHRDSNRMLKDAKKRLEQYQAEHRIATIIDNIEDQLLGYASHCEYDGVNFYIYFAKGYPLTFDIIKRGQTEATVAESWTSLRSMFTDYVFEYFPECTVSIIDHNGQTVGTYMKGETADQLTVLFDIATKPY